MLQNRHHKSLSCRLQHLLTTAAFFLCLLIGSMEAAQAQTKKDTIRAQRARPDLSLGLTVEEKLYLGYKNKLTFACDPHWPPFEFIDATDHYSGMGSDFIKIISNRIGTPFHLIRTESWSESLELAKAGKCDILPILNRTPERMEYLNFTTPYFITQYVILGRGSSWFDKGLDNMKGKTMAVVRGYKMEEDLRRDHPDIKLIIAETMEEALFMVHEGKAFATVSTILESSHIIRVSKLSGLKVIGHTEFINEPRMGVHKANAMLLSIMQKAIDSLTDAEKEMISVKWIAEGVKVESNRPLVMKTIGILLLCLAAIFFAFKKFK